MTDSPTTPDTPRTAHGDAPAGTILVTGATGYVGGLLVQPLLDAGRTVRVLTRDAGKLDRAWADRVEAVEGDAGDAADLDTALAGVDVAYYLLHSMDGQADFRERDRRMAQAFADACERAGVGRIIYLSGLHPEGELSDHLASRVEVGEVFLASSVPAAVFQAAVILGDGSVSFDMLRFLTERLPAMVAPKWLDNRIQPIAIDDVLHYLVHAADLPADVNRTFDIGGPDVLTYTDMIKRFATVTGHRPRTVQTLPVQTPKLAGYWVGLVTPVSPDVAQPLVGSLMHEVVCREHDVARYIPGPSGGPLGFDEAVQRAMADAEPSTGPRNLAIAAGATTVAAALGTWATNPDSPWYKSLDLPPWQPPKLAFPIVWTVLYATIAGVSASAVTTFEDREVDGDAARVRGYWTALGVNLALNAGWSWAFWRAERPWLAAGWSGVLAASSIDLARRAGAAGPGHRNFLLPYAAWCSFATMLSAEIWRRNR